MEEMEDDDICANMERRALCKGNDQQCHHANRKGYTLQLQSLECLIKSINTLLAFLIYHDLLLPIPPRYNLHHLAHLRIQPLSRHLSLNRLKVFLDKNLILALFPSTLSLATLRRTSRAWLGLHQPPPTLSTTMLARIHTLAMSLELVSTLHTLPDILVLDRVTVHGRDFNTSVCERKRDLVAPGLELGAMRVVAHVGYHERSEVAKLVREHVVQPLLIINDFTGEFDRAVVPCLGSVGWWGGRSFKSDNFAPPVCAAGGCFECVGPEDFYPAGGGGELGDGAGADSGVQFGKEGCGNVVFAFSELFSLGSDLLDSGFGRGSRNFLCRLRTGRFLLGAGDRTCACFVTAAAIVEVHAAHHVGDVVSPLLLSRGYKFLCWRVAVVPLVDDFRVPECIKAGSQIWCFGNEWLLFRWRDELRWAGWCEGRGCGTCNGGCFAW